jgi:hypothetical protein
MPLTPAALTAHRPDILFHEGADFAIARSERDDGRAIRPFDIEELVAIAEDQGAFAVRVNGSEFGEFGPLHDAVDGREEEEIALRVVIARNDRDDLLVLIKIKEVDGRHAFGIAAPSGIWIAPEL